MQNNIINHILYKYAFYRKAVMGQVRKKERMTNQEVSLLINPKTVDNNFCLFSSHTLNLKRQPNFFHY
ncbi:MAG: hypothetical protein DRP86_06730 [Candidatus Neomarinimicrobiota bacterium]|nr:MAG: hypothetical protein DRP86_06730 [Candidatus Neomarinimicrobiota bacterium]